MDNKNFNQYYTALELDKVLAKLADCADLADAKELSMTLSPSFDLGEVAKEAQ